MLPEVKLSENLVKPFDKNLDALGLSIATLTGLPVSYLLDYSPEKEKLSTHPASCNIGACTSMILESQSQFETYGSGTPHSLINILEAMADDLKKRPLNSEKADLLSFLVNFMELTDNHQEQERIINELDDRLYVLAGEVKDALEIDFNLVGIHEGYSQVIFNPRLNGKAQRILIMAALNQVLNPNQKMTDQEWLETTIIPIKQQLTGSEKQKIKLSSEWQSIATGGQGHFDRKRTIREQKQAKNIGPFHTWNYQVGPGRH